MIDDEMLSGLIDHFNGTVEIHPRERVIDGTPKRKSRPQSSRRRNGRPPVAESDVINQAKEFALARFGIPEPVIHRILHTFAMTCRIPFEDAAQIFRLGCMSLDYLKAHPDGTEAE